jgi:ferredoxin
MRIEIDQARCCGAGQCVLAAPEVFDQRDEDGAVVLRTDRPEPRWWEAVREAEDRCPAGAITVEGS